MAQVGTKTSVILLVISALSLIIQSLDLDRDLIRRSILDYRSKRSLQRDNVHDLDSHLRVKRQTAYFPTDDEDIDAAGSGDTDSEPLPPDVFATSFPPVEKGNIVSEWVWYRTKVNFMNSIVYTADLQDYSTDVFHSLSEKIMFSVEQYLNNQLSGYHEATPLMFTRRDDDFVDVLIDVGACSSNSMQDIDNTMRRLLRSGRVGDLSVSEEGFSIREVGKDPTRVECSASVQAQITTTTAATFDNEPLPPEFEPTESPAIISTTLSGSIVQVGPSRRPYRCNDNEATCRNGQCIDRSYICDGNRDCDDGSDEPASCGNADSTKCDPTEFLCIGTGVCAQKLWRCDGDDDCGNGYDELNCPTAAPGSACRGIEFECVSDSLCVPASYQCDGERDCSDGSDERGCAAPTVIRPPRKLVKVRVGGTVELDCWATGVPSPIVSWRLNWGNVGSPPRVTMTSSDGRGHLTITDVRPSDQGAYTCEAINSEGSIFAIPDAVVVIEDVQDDGFTCPPGQYGTTEGNCRPCYCFGVTDQCVPSKREYDEVGIEFNSPDDLGLVRLRPAEVEGADPTPVSEPINRNQIVVKPAARELQLIDLSKRFLAAAHYWSLPAQFLGAKINSYGGTLTFSFSYNNSYNFEPKPTNHSDVIIEGANGQTLVYHNKGEHPGPVEKHSRVVNLTEDAFTTPEGIAASREEMLNVLNNVDKILLRTVYDNSMLSTGIGDIRMQLANPPRAVGRGSTGITAISVEECECPPGYEGTSCQFCSPGYERISVGGNAGNCEIIANEPTPTPPARQCDVGYTGFDCSDCVEGYTRVVDLCLRYPDTECDTAGSIGVTVGGGCDCKPGCEGERCDRCKRGYFFLSELNADGCLSCFCMGVSRDCDSTSWRRDRIIASFNESNERYILTNSGGTRIFQDHIVQSSWSGRRPSARAHLDELPRDVYYWMLPDKFIGNQIASYGGEFRYTIMYDQEADARPITRIADVKIFGNNIVLEHRGGRHPDPNTEYPNRVIMREDYWVRPDGTAATREHLMMALADVESFLVRASYSNNMMHTVIHGISLETATAYASGSRAMDVEQCVCPDGYTGLSCEDCATGYRRTTEGPYLGSCVRCSCNRHSQSCDERTGSCIQCQHNTEGDNCERCIPGFYGDPRLGTPADCTPCPCPILPARGDRNQVASCSVGIDGLPTCDLCPRGYEGRQCERCANGYSSDLLLPGSPCVKEGSNCQCDPYGSLDGTCDADGQCNCKESVTGLKCDSCKPSYFYFSVENENGCLPCFCMGVTRNCESSYLVRDKITANFNGDDFGGFAMTNRVRGQRFIEDLRVRSRGTVLTRARMNILASDTYYWQLPEDFLGNRVVSYGGELKYSVSYTPSASGVPTRDHDVIIIGNDITLVASIDGDVLPRELTDRSVVFKERNWRRPDGQPATREHLLMALADLENILIRATYSTSMLESSLSQLSMETSSANEFDGGDIAYEVESCTCPNGYEGHSCEDCSPGYTRSGGGLYLGLCQPCQCNGHADTCDPETGECINCQDNTVGRNCDQCAPGYYSMSDNPVDMYCQRCACPGIGENSFSETCEYFEETRNLVCNRCQEGYEGTRCENCAEGYEGNPRISGGRCSKRGSGGIISQDPPVVSVTPASVNIQEGKSVTLRCIVKSSPPVRVTWRRTDYIDGRIISNRAIISDRDYTLTVPSVSREDAGTYECIAQNQGGVARDQAVITIARSQPMIKVRVEQPTNRRLRTGESVTFVCTASSKMPGYIVYWSKQGGRLPSKPRATDYGGILHISDLTEADSGTYVCTGSNMYQIDRASAVLTVVRENTAVRPSVSITPARQVIREGEEAMFRCSADGTQPIKIEWRPSAGEEMPESAKIIDGELYIPSVGMDHSAVFYCRASNSLGIAEATALLDVTAIGYPPKVTVVTPTKVIINEGQNVEMRCVATGLPRALFSWSRVGQPGLPGNAESRGEILQIINSNVSNQDTYVCTARNTFGEDSGSIELIIRPTKQITKPVCKTDPESLTAYVGADASITCLAEGDPLPVVTWVRSDGRRLQSNAEIKGNKLIIHNVTVYNAGKYVCIATNAGGTTRSEMTLKVEDKQLPQVEILPRNQQVVELGESASFTCKPISGHPVEVTWSRTDRKPFTERTTLEDGGVIRFTNATEKEGGSYICIATNVVGFREVATLLNVVRMPTVTVEPSTEVYLRKGSSITLRCNADGIPVPNVVWKKVSAFGRLVAMTHYKRHSNQLRLANVRLTDSSRYRCVAVSAYGDAEKTVTVTVGEKEAILEPSVSIEKSVVSTVLGGRVLLRCVASGQPKPRGVWSRQFGRLPSGSTQTDGVLTIPRTTQRDAGVYVCSAENTAGSDSDKSTLQIIVAPRLRISPSGPIFKLASGQSAVITCSAVEGTEPIIYQFTKAVGRMSQNIITSGGRMQILSFNEIADSGRYICTGRNGAGTTTADVTILPMSIPLVSVEALTNNVNVGGSIELQCISSDSNAVVGWTRTDGASLPAARASQLNGILLVEDATLSDAGEYKCTAVNDAGSGFKSLVVAVQGAPKAKLTTSVKVGDVVSVGDRVELTCSATRTPTPEITITKDGVEVLLSVNDRLVLDPVLSSDAGSYACIATSSSGSNKDVFVLEVQVPVPSSLSIIPDSKTLQVRSGEELAISCVLTGTDIPISWSKQDGELSSAAKIVGTLIQIDSISTGDAGTYVCSANVGDETLEKTISVVVEASLPYFTQSPLSYITLKENPDFYRSLRITVSFRPVFGSGILFYSFGTGGDYISLTLFDEGKISFRYNVGSGDAVLTSVDRVTLGEWHTVSVTRQGREGQLVVDDAEPVRGTSEGNFRSLDLNQPLFIGGYPLDGQSLPPALDYLGFDVGFYGCFSQLVIGDESIDLRSSKHIRDRVGISRCKTCGSNDEDTPCQHESTCLETHFSAKGYVCGCSDEYVGPECQFRKEDICGDLDACGQHGSCTPDYDRELGYRCECLPGYAGPKCQYDELPEPRFVETATVTDSYFETPRVISEAAPTGFGASLNLETGNELDLDSVPDKEGTSSGFKIDEATSFGRESYMQLDVNHSNRRQFDVKMKIKPDTLEDGLILYNGGVQGGRRRAADDSEIFVSLALKNGKLEFRYDCGSGLATLTSTGPDLEVGEWYSIHANRANRKGLLKVNGETVAEGQSPRGGRSADLNGPLYVGGVKFWDQVPDHTGVRDGFEGCIEKVIVDGNYASLNLAVDSKNTEPCVAQTSTAQTTDAATTEGTTSTERTTTMDLVHELDIDTGPLFLHSGHPAAKNTGPLSGPLAKFHGDSFASFSEYTFPHNTVAEQFSLYFKTTDPDGLLLAHGRANSRPSGGDFLMLGLRDARLQYTFQLGTSQGKAMGSFPVADGQWHRVTVVRRGSLALMWIDELSRPIAIQAQGVPAPNVRLGDLYIGGVHDVAKHTGNRFKRGFTGCIRDVRITSMDQQAAMQVGTTYLDDSDVVSLLFGEFGGRKSANNISKCRSEERKKSGRRAV